MALHSERKKEKTSTYLLRLTPEEKNRWQKMAEVHALPLAEYIRRRVEGRPVSPPKVPAINVDTCVQMGHFDLQLRRMVNDLNQAIDGREQQQPISTTSQQQLIETAIPLRTLVMEVREELREVRLQLSGVEVGSNSEEIPEDEYKSNFDEEDWE